VRRLISLAILIAFIFSCGGEWYVLQCVAWANMIREYSAVVPVAQAVEMTFSGHYPCALCKAIASRKRSDQQKALALEKYDKKFVLPGETSTYASPSLEVIYSSPAVVLRDRNIVPWLPPPRPA
jgi:nitrate reductase beta subunit